MKLVCISDTHNKHMQLADTTGYTGKTTERLPAGDILLHAGDFSGIGAKYEVEEFLEWLIEQAEKYTYGAIFIAGNHDRSFDPKFSPTGEKPDWLQTLLSDLTTTKVTYLENESVVVGSGSDALKIWGSPITPWFHGDRWAFNKHRGPEISEVWKEIPLDTDIVITHGPISYKLDYIPSTAQYVGCEDFRRKLEAVGPLLHLCGHIHEGFGWDENIHTTFLNASTCNEYYHPGNKPWEVLVDKPNKRLDIF